MSAALLVVTHLSTATVMSLCCCCCCCVLQPLLDVLLFTRSLSRVMGYKGQLGLYAYYMFVAWLLRTLAPPLAAMTAQESALVGAFRCAVVDRRQCVYGTLQHRPYIEVQGASGTSSSTCSRLATLTVL
jgi:hypothetical protein